MIEFLRKLWAALRGVAVPTNDAETLCAPATAGAAPAVPPEPAKEELDPSARWTFRGSVLDKIETHMRVAGMLKRRRPDVYALCGKLGAVLLPDNAGFRWADSLMLDVPRALIGKVTFGAVSVSDPTDPGPNPEYQMAFIVFTKLAASPTGVQRSPGRVYQVTVVHDLPKESRASIVEYHVSVGDSGEVSVLKELWEDYQRVGGFKSSSHVIQKKWVYPMGAENRDYFVRLFCWAYQAYINARSAVQVRVSKGATSATFGIDPGAAPDFFSDRDRVSTPAGGTKRIFHFVKAHRRARSDGGDSYVRVHTRGLREFTWNGYAVRVSVPGRDEIDVLDFDVPAHSQDPQPGRAAASCMSTGHVVDKLMSHQYSSAAH